MKFVNTLVFIGLIFTMAGAHAGVVIGGTRLIYDGSKKESSLSVNNPDKNPYLIQSWITNADGGKSKVPFVLTPPLFRLDGEQQNVLRVVRAGSLPEDKETLYWINVKAIPSDTGQENTLQIAICTQLKLIYRPASLAGASPEQQTDKLVWSRNGNQLEVKNPTNYYMNFNEITVGGKKVDHVTYLAPQSTATFALPKNSGNTLTWNIINDYGVIGVKHKAAL